MSRLREFYNKRRNSLDGIYKDYNIEDMIYDLNHQELEKQEEQTGKSRYNK